MSVVISYVSEDISLIATDTRVSFRNGFYTDDNIKLYDMKNLEWTAGVGSSYFITTMRNKLNDKVIKTTDDILEVYNDCYNQVKKLNIYSKEEIDNTGIITSWNGLTKNNKQISRIGIFSKRLTSVNEFMLLENNSIYILYPKDFIDSNKKFKLIEEKFEMSFIFNDNINDLIIKIIKIFINISLNSNYVSDIIDIGISVLGEGKFRVKENINNLEDL